MSSSSQNTQHPDPEEETLGTAASPPSKKRGRGDGKKWTPEKVELLTRLWNDGVETSVIIEKLGKDFTTRSAIIAKANRLGLKRPGVTKKGGGKRGNWTDDKVAALKKLWEDGDSAEDIAETLTKKFDVKVTRNAVTQKANRLGLPSRRGATTTDPQKTPVTKKKRNFNAGPTNKPAPKKTKQPRRAGENDSTIGTVTMLNLTNESCRWVVGKPAGINTLFCGAAQLEGSAYCPDHRKEAHQKGPGTYNPGLADKAFP